ncbi:hypothetical protein LC048_13680 [Mesobacillus subterraneus]|uniref:hypothetical protein n=1 Tax=Mesobacillus subterraneus TaxID=285983 RepID=UPI001CFEE2DA|nr:hypothetical protein [Mesobacillus subterraneus]WLR53573.1 hypothetical protein LC048_13680 [Mesobacillus subterraneus]
MKPKKVNPVIAKAREEGYQEGYRKGTHFGFDQGKYSACMLFADKFDGLEKVPGIGPKMMEKIVNHFGKEYFQEVKK